MKLLLDANRYRDFTDGVPEVVARLEQTRTILVSLITLAELRAGFACGTRTRANERSLVSFLEKPGVAVLVPDEVTTRHYADLYAQLRRVGRPIPPHELWLAAQARQHDLTIYTRDRHFDDVPGIRRI